MADTITPVKQTFRRKHSEVVAHQYNGFGSLNVISNKKGQQTARAGDFIVQDDEAVAALRQQEKDQHLPENSLGQKGTVYVMTKAEFFAEFDLLDENGNPVNVDNAATPLYGVPNFASVELAQAAAAASDLMPFRCTIGQNIQLYSIQKDGVTTVVPTVSPDPTQDIGPTHEEGARIETPPQSLQNEGVHDTAPSPDVQTPLVSEK